jgi:hypothetical protein
MDKYKIKDLVNYTPFLRKIIFHTNNTKMELFCIVIEKIFTL